MSNEEGTTRYYRRQSNRAVWIGMAMVAVLMLPGVAIAQWVGATGIGVAIGGVLALATVMNFALAGQSHTAVESDRLEFWHGPLKFYRYSLRLSDITGVEPASVPPIVVAASGFPRRRISDGALLLGGPGPALLLTVRDGRRVLLGTDDAPGLTAALAARGVGATRS